MRWTHSIWILLLVACEQTLPPDALRQPNPAPPSAPVTVAKPTTPAKPLPAPDEPHYLDTPIIPDRPAYRYEPPRKSAVQLSLEWLIEQQHEDGGWSFQGEYENPGTDPSRVKATAMCMLALQGAGHTLKKGKHKANVTRGYQFLVAQFKADEDRRVATGDNADVDSHAIATLAVCELYGMTRDPSVEVFANGLVAQLVHLQKPEGHWVKDEPGDLVWPIMALRSAQTAKLEIPRHCLEGVSRAFNRYHLSGGLFAGPDSHPGHAASASGILVGMFLGRFGLIDCETGLDFLLRTKLLDRQDCRNQFVATQIMFYAGGSRWVRWNDVNRDNVVDRQGEDGTWFEPMDHQADRGGRLYQTAINVYMLEVYYRHLPIYSSVRLD